MRQPASIFNDVIGPVMVGPSSSHTAASVRIGHLLRHMCLGKPQHIICEFSRFGSLAFCHEGQGTDMGLAAGLMGWAAHDECLPQAVVQAKTAGINLEFRITDKHFEHPNTYQVYATGGGCQFTAAFISVGGGMIEMKNLNGIPLCIDGGYYETLFLLGSCGSEAAQQTLEKLSTQLADYEDIYLTGDGAGNYIVNVKSNFALSHEIWDGDILYLPPVLPIQSYKHHAGLFNTAIEIEALEQEQNLSLAELALLYESRRGRISQAEVFNKMRELLSVMRRAIKRAEQKPPYTDRILPPQAHLLAKTNLLPNQTQNAAIWRITLLMEAKSAMLPIVASPTAGSCAALPGAIIGVAESLGKSEEEMIQALLAAGLIGVLIAEHATFAAEVGGCQAECGAASGMAAAGLTQLMGGSAQKALNAASMALQNVFGLVCDPVASRVEVPCLGKNILAGTNAIAMANLAIAGFDPVIPLDETIAAMREVGQKIDATLRCTCQGGLSVTPTSHVIEKRLRRALPAVNKTELRQLIKQRLANADKSALAQIDKQICQNLRQLPEFIQARTILAFAPLANEINIWPLLESLAIGNQQLCLPLITGHGIMEARVVDNISQLHAGSYGIAQPPLDAAQIAPVNIDLVLTPGLAFDRKLWRLGRGGGYYDRFLSDCGAFRLGLAREAQIVEQLVHEPHDLRMHALLSEAGYLAGSNS